MTITNKRSLIALLLSLVLVVSLFTVSLSATEVENSTEGTIEVVTDAATDAVTDAATDVATEEATAEADESNSESVSETEKETETETDNTAALIEKQQNEKKKTLIVNFAIIGVIVLIAVLLCVKFRAKLGDFMRSVKSEMKKIVWSSKENTRKSFLVVIVVALAVAILLGLMDFAFSTGINQLASLFK